MVRGKKIHRLTKDHSLVQQMVDSGIITAEAAKEHPQKNVITRSLGSDASGEPEVAQPFQTFKNDKYILCSDGLTGYLEDDEILQIVNANPIQEACRILIDTANERGGKDNITVQIVEVKNGKSLPEESLLKNKTLQLIGAVIVFLAAVILAIYQFKLLPFEITNSPKNDKPTLVSKKTKTKNDTVHNTIKNELVPAGVNNLSSDKPPTKEKSK
jgi:sulfur transfer complex TusBCD TusB component (DsrH family)